MIRSIRGRVLAHESDGPVIEVGGVGYSVQVTPAQAASLVEGQEAMLLTSLIVREDSLSLFGFADALRLVLGNLGSPVPSQFLSMLPYLATIFAVAGLVGRVRPPAAEGIPYVK